MLEIRERDGAMLDPWADHITRQVVSKWPSYGRDEIDAVAKVLESGRVNSLVHGEETRAFEREFAEFTEMPFALAVSNGTVSLELALRAVGVCPGDEVIVPARSFFATVSCVVAVGATPVFADILPDGQTIDPQSVQRLVSKRTRALICVHLAGVPCEMDSLTALCREHNLKLVEDCAQAHGARFAGRPVGSFGDASSFSFCTDKIMSTGGEGGMVLFAEEEAWARAFAYKDHGKDPRQLRQPAEGPVGEFRYLHDSFGSNYRLTEMQAAIGRIQLRKLPDWLARRSANALWLNSAFAGLPGVALERVPERAEPAWYKYYVRLDLPRLPGGMTRSDVIAGLTARRISCGSGSCPDMSLERALDGHRVRRDGELPNARALGACSLMFPVDHLLGIEDMEAIALAMRSVLS